MRFVPLLPSDFDPLPWRPFPAVELAWASSLHPHWRQGAPAVHAVHLAAAAWTGDLGNTVLTVLRARLEPDFLVIPADCPETRLDHSAFMTVLEGLLEVTHGTGVKLALRPGPGQAPGLVRLLKEARGEAVGYCWDAGVGDDLEIISDRLFCAVGGPGATLAPLQRLGYRWNLAVASQDPGLALAELADLARAYPPVLFPADLGSAPASTPAQEHP